jgi:hypothetical protein
LPRCRLYHTSRQSFVELIVHRSLFLEYFKEDNAGRWPHFFEVDFIPLIAKFVHSHGPAGKHCNVMSVIVVEELATSTFFFSRAFTARLDLNHTCVDGGGSNYGCARCHSQTRLSVRGTPLEFFDHRSLVAFHSHALTRPSIQYGILSKSFYQ